MLIGVVIARVAFSFQLQSVAVVAPGLADGLGLDSTSLGTIIGLFMLPGLVLAIPGSLPSRAHKDPVVAKAGRPNRFLAHPAVEGRTAG